MESACAAVKEWPRIVKAFLMYPDRDFDPDRERPPSAGDLLSDLELGTLLEAMAAGDEFLYTVAEKAVLGSLTDPAEIVYRQDILRDCLSQPAIIGQIYAITVDAIARERREYFSLFRGSPDAVLQRSVRVLEIFMTQLRMLRTLTEENAGDFRSEGFTRFFRMLSKELDDEFFTTVSYHLAELRFRRGVLVSAELGQGNLGVGYVLRKAPEQNWIGRISARSPGYSFQIPDRDDNGFKALGDLKGRGLNPAASALAQSVDHILSFFRMLRCELAFYVGCINMYQRLAGKGEPTCFPVPLAGGQPGLVARGLYDPCLSLQLADRVVGNDVSADGTRLIMVTGANQGGKSTFLRSVGVAQLMMQCGMFTPAEELSAAPCQGVFTHFKREEDATMESGKLDEELRRMSAIVDRITSGSLLLCNESFASTNEREGSEIARQIVCALLDRGIWVIVVTHLFDLAQRFYTERAAGTLFLRARRRPDGSRPFQVAEGEPLPTSHGPDVYRRIFSEDPSRAAVSPGR